MNLFAEEKLWRMVFRKLKHKATIFQRIMDKLVQACSTVNFGVFPCSLGLKLKVCWMILEFNTTYYRNPNKRATAGAKMSKSDLFGYRRILWAKNVETLKLF